MQNKLLQLRIIGNFLIIFDRHEDSKHPADKIWTLLIIIVSIKWWKFKAFPISPTLVSTIFTAIDQIVIFQVWNWQVGKLGINPWKLRSYIEWS